MIHEKKREEILTLLKDDSDYKKTQFKRIKKDDFLVNKIKDIFNEKSVHVCKAKDDFYAAGNHIVANRMRYELHKMFM